MNVPWTRGDRMGSIDGDVPLLTLLPQISRLVFSCRDKSDMPCTKSQLYILAALLSRESMTMKEIAHILGSSSEQATRAVAPLADAGLLERFSDPANRQHVHIRLTEAGRIRVEKDLTALSHRIDAHLRASLTETEQKDLHAALLRAIELLCRVA